jgi:ParB family chromosome partitioning protein
MTTGAAVWQERIFGRDVLRTRRDRVPLSQLRPNDRQPRQGPKIDPELKKQILENGGIFEPLLVEPDPEFDGRLRIIDGDRRWTNSLEIVKDLEAEQAKEDEKEKYRLVPVEATDRALSDEERFRVWVYIHRQRKEWSRREKEGAAFNLARFMDRARAANILGISVRELDKLISTFEISQKLTSLPDPDASITWAREIINVSPKYRPAEVEATLIRKINKGLLRNSKEVRELRRIVPYEPALKEFLRPEGTIQTALQKLPNSSQRGPGRGTYGVGLVQDVATFADQLSRYSWTELEGARDDPALIDALDIAEQRLALLRKALGGRRARRAVPARLMTHDSDTPPASDGASSS